MTNVKYRGRRERELCFFWLRQVETGRTVLIDHIGENSHIAHFDKICSKLVRFRKYLIMYQFFNTRISQNRVLNSTQYYEEFSTFL